MGLMSKKEAPRQYLRGESPALGEIHAAQTTKLAQRFTTPARTVVLRKNYTEFALRAAGIRIQPLS